MWKLFVLTALGLGQLVSAKSSVECVSANTTCGGKGKDYSIKCGYGQIRIESVELVMPGSDKCDCLMERQPKGCTEDVDKGEEKQWCKGKYCNIPVQMIQDLLNCSQDEGDQPRAIRITYTCDSGQKQAEPKKDDGTGNNADSNMTNIVIAATVSALVVLAIVMIVFAVLYVHKRKTSTRSANNRNADMNDAHFHSKCGFDEDYNTIPADYDMIRSRKSEHKYYSIDEQTRDTDVANGKATTEMDNEYDVAKHGRPGQHNDIDKNAYNDCSNGQSITGTYNTMLFNKPHNAQTNVGDYSHLSQQGNDYSHLGDITDDANPASNDYNRLQEEVDDYDDARTHSPEDSNNETNLNTEHIKRKGSYEELVLAKVTENLVTDHVSSDDADSEEENSSEMKTDALQLPFKKTIDEPIHSSSIDEDCVSLDSYESLPTEENSQPIDSTRSKRDSYEIPELTPPDTEEGFDAEIVNDNSTDDTKLGDTAMVESSARAMDNVDG